MGVSCFAERVGGLREVRRHRARRRAGRGSPPSRAARSSPASARCSTSSANCAGRALLIIGAGGVGLCGVMGARLVGADPIIVVDVDAGASSSWPGASAPRTLVNAGRETPSSRSGRSPRRRGLGDRGRRPRGDAATGLRVPAPRRHGGRARPRARGRDVRGARSTSSCSGRSGSSAACTDPPTRCSTSRGCWRSTLRAACRWTTCSASEYPLDSVNDAYAALVAGAVGRAPSCVP